MDNIKEVGVSIGVRVTAYTGLECTGFLVLMTTLGKEDEKKKVFLLLFFKTLFSLPTLPNTQSCFLLYLSSYTTKYGVVLAVTNIIEFLVLKFPQN